MRLPVISKALQRYRVSRGYGVHSPFAYRFIIRVLRETLPYYGFDRLNSLRADMTVAAAPLSAEGLADVRCPVIMTTRCPEPLWQHAIDTSARAMTFTNGRTGVIVNRSGLPRHDYRLRF